MALLPSMIISTIPLLLLKYCPTMSSAVPDSRLAPTPEFKYELRIEGGGRGQTKDEAIA